MGIFSKINKFKKNEAFSKIKSKIKADDIFSSEKNVLD
jgi:hypothetical protein